MQIPKINQWVEKQIGVFQESKTRNGFLTLESMKTVVCLGKKVPVTGQLQGGMIRKIGTDEILKMNVMLRNCNFIL